MEKLNVKKAKESLIDFFKKFALLFMGWFLIPLAKCYSWTLKKTGRLKVIGSFPKGGGFLIVGNHESFGTPPEIIMEVYLSDPLNFTNPIQYFPWVVQAEDNFLKYFFFLRAHIGIWVDRKEMISRFLALRKAKRILDRGGNVILFPVGMRDYHSLSRLESDDGNELLGDLFHGAGWLATHGKNGKPVPVVPFGTKGYSDFVPNERLPIPRPWAKREIRVGKPFSFAPNTSVEEATKKIKAAILEQIIEGEREK